MHSGRTPLSNSMATRSHLIQDPTFPSILPGFTRGPAHCPIRGASYHSAIPRLGSSPSGNISEHFSKYSPPSDVQGRYPATNCRSVHHCARELVQRSKALNHLTKGEAPNTRSASATPSLVPRSVIHLLRIWSQVPLHVPGRPDSETQPGPPASPPRASPTRVPRFLTAVCLP